jgi:hypothetical protein
MEQLTGAAPGTFTGMSAQTAVTLADHAATLAEQHRHNTQAESTAAQNANTAASRANIASLSQQETVRYHNALIRIKNATAAGKTAAPKDVRIAFTTAVKIGYKFLGTKQTVKVGNVSVTKPGVQVPYDKALGSMTAYWQGVMPSWTPKQATAKAKQTLAAIPGYKGK